MDDRQKIMLLADDDIDDTDMFREALSLIDESVTCYFAMSGVEVHQKLGELDALPQVILLDINMPLMDGWDCLKLLKETGRYCDIPVIMISTSSHTQDIDKALELGALCYMIKPPSFKILKELVMLIVEHLGNNLEDKIAIIENNMPAHIFRCNDSSPS